MIELSKHIVCLLLENDCVTVPEFGGFITHYQPARYEEAEGLFLPPIRTVGFNPQLTMNDGLLAQSYMQAYHTDFPDASRRIQTAVDELKEILFTDGVAELHGVGTMNYNIRGQYEFQPAESGVLSPSLYGLSSFQIAPLGEEAVAEEPVMEVETIVPEKKQTKEIKLMPHWVNHVAAAAVAIILFFTFSIPVENTYVDHGSYASLATASLFDDIRSHSMATKVIPAAKAEKAEAVAEPQIKPVAVKVEKAAPFKVEKTAPAEVKTTPVASVKETPKAEPAKQQAAPATAKKKYHVIVSSLATQADAQKMLQSYARKGYSEATVVEGSGRFRIALYSYADRSSAQQKLSELKQNDAFKDAWMLTSK